MILEARELLIELISLGCFVLYIFFSYCDGFGLRTSRKLFWGLCFLALSFNSFIANGHFDLAPIILFSSLLAFVLAWIQRKENLRKNIQSF